MQNTCSLSAMQVMRQRHKIEKDLWIGAKVGWWKNVEVAKTNPDLAQINKTFGMVHAFAAGTNVFSIGGLAFHSWYIASYIVL